MCICHKTQFLYFLAFRVLQHNLSQVIRQVRNNLNSLLINTTRVLSYTPEIIFFIELTLAFCH